MAKTKMKSEFEFSRADLRDAEFIWKLRNSPEVREVSINTAPIMLSNHENWFENHYTEYWIINDYEGFLRLEKDGNVSIVLNKESRGKGLGQKVLAKQSGKAIILMNNPASLHCFIKAGFKLRGFYLEK